MPVPFVLSSRVITNGYTIDKALRIKKIYSEKGSVRYKAIVFLNLFHEPTDSRFPKIRIKLKIDFFLFAPIRNSSLHFM